jgi:hypothetical protein
MNAVRPSTGALRAPAQDEAIFFTPSNFMPSVQSQNATVVRRFL